MPARQRTSIFACTRPMDVDFVPGKIKIIGKIIIIELNLG